MSMLFTAQNIQNVPKSMHQKEPSSAWVNDRRVRKECPFIWFAWHMGFSKPTSLYKAKKTVAPGNDLAVHGAGPWPSHLLHFSKPMEHSLGSWRLMPKPMMRIRLATIDRVKGTFGRCAISFSKKHDLHVDRLVGFQFILRHTPKVLKMLLLIKDPQNRAKKGNLKT